MLGQTKDHIDSDGTVLDIGAAVGQYSKFLMWSWCGSVYSGLQNMPTCLKGTRLFLKCTNNYVKVQNDYLNFSAYNIAI